MALRSQTPESRNKQIADRRAAEQDVFLREVDEAVRQDELSGFMRRFGIPLLVAIVVGLLALGAFLWWQHSRQQGIGERSEELVRAIDQLEAGQLATADKMLAAIASGDGAGAAAKLLRGGVAEQQGKAEDAAKLFSEVAADEAAPKPFRDLATVREVAARFDTLPPQQVIDRLKPLAVPGNAWFGTAGELVGMAYLKQDRRDLAGPLFASIARDEQTPETLRRRARQLAGLLGVDAIDDVARAVADEGGGQAPE